MQLTITSVDYAPEELFDQTPFQVTLIRQIPGDDRPDYWLGELTTSVRWIHQNHEKSISHVVLCSRWEGTQIEPNVEHLPIGIAYVTDPTLLEDPSLSFSKCAYVAIGLCDDTSGGKIVSPLKEVVGGTIGKSFGKGNR